MWLNQFLNIQEVPHLRILFTVWIGHQWVLFQHSRPGILYDAAGKSGHQSKWEERSTLHSTLRTCTVSNLH